MPSVNIQGSIPDDEMAPLLEYLRRAREVVGHEAQGRGLDTDKVLAALLLVALEVGRG